MGESDSGQVRSLLNRYLLSGRYGSAIILPLLIILLLLIGYASRRLASSLILCPASDLYCAPYLHFERWSADGQQLIFRANLWDEEGRRVRFSQRPYHSRFFTVRRDGTGLTALTEAMPTLSPEWSPDGRQRLRIGSEEGVPAGTLGVNYVSTLYITGADDRERRLAADLPPVASFLWSPDNRHVALSATVLLGQLESSGNIRYIEPSGYIGYADASGYVGNTNLSGYIGYGEILRPVELSDLIVIDTVSAATRYLIRDFTLSDFAWSPDGRRIAVVSDSHLVSNDDGITAVPGNGDTEIYLIDVDGRHFAALTDNSAYDGMPQWSPDGTQLLFLSERDGGYGLYVTKTDSEQQTLLASLEGNRFVDGGGSPLWSPNGDLIAFINGSQIYVVSVASSSPVPLTPSRLSVRASSYAWSPDGQQIAFVADSGHKLGLYHITVDGSNLARVTP